MQSQVSIGSTFFAIAWNSNKGYEMFKLIEFNDLCLTINIDISSSSTWSTLSLFLDNWPFSNESNFIHVCSVTKSFWLTKLLVFYMYDIHDSYFCTRFLINQVTCIWHVHAKVWVIIFWLWEWTIFHESFLRKNWYVPRFQK